MASDTWEALRALVARRDGYRCIYCQVPTGATIEHVTARIAEGGHDAENLRLACPSCNSRKGAEPLASWLAREGWRMDLPPDLEPTTEQMIAARFGGLSESGSLTTGSTNARLLMIEGIVRLEVRVGKKHPWKPFDLGPQDNPVVVRASYDFLRRHHTSAGSREHQDAARRQAFAVRGAS